MQTASKLHAEGLQAICKQTAASTLQSNYNKRSEIGVGCIICDYLQSYQTIYILQSKCKQSKWNCMQCKCNQSKSKSKCKCMQSKCSQKGASHKGAIKLQEAHWKQTISKLQAQLQANCRQSACKHPASIMSANSIQTASSTLQANCKQTACNDTASKLQQSASKIIASKLQANCNHTDEQVCMQAKCMQTHNEQCAPRELQSNHANPQQTACKHTAKHM